jgi:hypothetical protein
MIRLIHNNRMQHFTMSLCRTMHMAPSIIGQRSSAREILQRLVVVNPGYGQPICCHSNQTLQNVREVPDNVCDSRESNTLCSNHSHSYKRQKRHYRKYNNFVSPLPRFTMVRWSTTEVREQSSLPQRNAEDLTTHTQQLDSEYSFLHCTYLRRHNVGTAKCLLGVLW